MSEFFQLPKQIQLRELMRFITITLGSSIFPFMAMYYTTYFGTFMTGILMMITSLSGFLGTMYGGHLSDAIGRKKVVIIGSIGTIIGWFLTITANIPGHLIPWLTFLGILLVDISSCFYGPAYEAMLIDLTDSSNRRFVYTINYWLINIAVMFGAGIAGLFYDHYFIELLLAMFVVNLLCFFVAYYKFHETRPDDHDFAHNSSLSATFKNYSEVFKDRAFVIFTMGSILFSSVWMQMDNYIPVHLKLYFETTHLFGFEVTGAKMLSIMVFTNTFLIVFFMTLVNKLTVKWKLLPQLLIGSIIFSVGVFLSFTFTHFIGIWIAVLIFTVGEMINVPANQVLRADMMDQSKIGSYTGFVSMAHPLGAILAGFLVSLSHFSGPIGVQIMFLVIATAGIYLTLLSARMKKKV
ncbi:MFS transporter [Streptococcus iniae]|uniref:MFS transporter n=2 Tax=Streptococcus iniae TaxID=1346 RepID=A0ABN4DAN4_STRIN|nr:MFS transporter [Streptococcus iniae]AGM99894.1 transporter, major facilitator family protein [Streptococcus iniae SF1]AHY16737.1 MFS transporter [Streptococcus iniae]AHY18602.1 MFS transporter [Streptococcus iniae]AJG26864.1 MFS transporter [Streptococcus iniae]APD32762.1 MFS transporter [Streptococcus iniae]